MQLAKVLSWFADVHVCRLSVWLPCAVTRVVKVAPTIRSLLIKHPLAYPNDPERVATEPASKRGSDGTVILSDPVHAVLDPEVNDIDVAATVQAVVASAAVRRLFWVFLDHQMTAGPLEKVLDTLARQHSEQVMAVNLDQALRLCQRDAATRRCFG